MSNKAARDPFHALSIEDFELLDMIGEGSYSVVWAARLKGTDNMFAIKQLSKPHVVKENKVEAVKREKMILEKLAGRHDIIYLHKTFQDAMHLYFLFDICPNGNLLETISLFGALEEECARFYIAEIVLATRFLRTKGIAHRDLKPENVLLKHDRHIVLADFGSAIELGNDTRSRSKSFVGTAEYVPPELLSQTPSTGLCGDLWSLGCLIFHLLVGKSPFTSPPKSKARDTEWVVFRRIKRRKLIYPNNFNIPHAVDLIEKLLSIEPGDRLSYDDLEMNDIISHPFFDGVDWDTIPITNPPLLRSSYTRWEFDPVVDDEEVSEDQSSTPASRDNSGSEDTLSADEKLNLQPPENEDDEEQLQKADEHDHEKETDVVIDDPPNSILDDFSDQGDEEIEKQKDKIILNSQQNDIREIGSSLLFRELPSISTESSSSAGPFVLTPEAIKQQRLQTIAFQRKTMQPWAKFLMPEIEVIKYMSYVVKRVGLSKKRRKMILTDRPRLIYIDPERLQQKGEVPWSTDLRIEVKDKRFFNIITPKRTYFFEDVKDEALEWKKHINEALARPPLSIASPNVVRKNT